MAKQLRDNPDLAQNSLEEAMALLEGEKFILVCGDKLFSTAKILLSYRQNRLSKKIWDYILLEKDNSKSASWQLIGKNGVIKSRGDNTA